MSNISDAQYSNAIDTIKNNCRVAINFHPDRLGPEFTTVADALLKQGIYKGQFETKISNGSVSAHPGGERDLWENALFGGAYNSNSCLLSERPKYGALDLLRHPDGPASRFGSCYFILRSEVTSRCTFTWFDSHQNPEERGCIDELDDIFASLLTEIFTRDYALGEYPLTVTDLFSRIEQLKLPYKAPHLLIPKRTLNHYIEAQIHGNIKLHRDVQSLVADPSFRNDRIGNVLEAIANKYNIELFWHSGFRIPVSEIPSDFRGPSMPSLAKRIAKNGILDTRAIGIAAASVKKNPDKWSDRGTERDILQELKLLWHVLSKFVRPWSNG